MNVRPGVPYIDPPAPYFTGNGYSELVAAGFPFTIVEKQIRVRVPKSVDSDVRDEFFERLKQIGFDGLVKYETNYDTSSDSVEILLVVE